MKVFDLKEVEYKTGFVLKLGFTLGKLVDGLAKELNAETYSNGHKRFLRGHLALPQVIMKKGGIADSTSLRKWSWNYLCAEKNAVQTATEISADCKVDVTITGITLSNPDCVISIKKR